MVEVLALDGQQEATGIAPVGTIGEGRPMMGNGQLYPSEGEIPAPADMQAVSCEPLIASIGGYLMVTDDGSPGPLGNGHSIAQVVAVGVGDQDVIRFYLVSADRSQGIACQEGINQQGRPSALDAETGMSVISEFYWHSKPPSQKCWVNMNVLWQRYYITTGVLTKVEDMGIIVMRYAGAM